MMKRIMCPNCARKGINTLLARASSVQGEGYLLLWCKKCKSEVRIPLEYIAEWRRR